MSPTERVRQLSDLLIAVLAMDPADVAIIALVDAAARILQVHGGFNLSGACTELARVAREIAASERTH